MDKIERYSVYSANQLVTAGASGMLFCDSGVTRLVYTAFIPPFFVDLAAMPFQVSSRRHQRRILPMTALPFISW